MRRSAPVMRSVTARGDSVPYADRLFLGGEYSVRGYPTDSLGPLDPDGVALGGEFLFVVNQELQARLYDSLTGLACSYLLYRWLGMLTGLPMQLTVGRDRKSTRLNSSH